MFMYPLKISKQILIFAYSYIFYDQRLGQTRSNHWIFMAGSPTAGSTGTASHHGSLGRVEEVGGSGGALRLGDGRIWSYLGWFVQFLSARNLSWELYIYIYILICSDTWKVIEICRNLGFIKENWVSSSLSHTTRWVITHKIWLAASG